MAFTKKIKASKAEKGKEEKENSNPFKKGGKMKVKVKAKKGY